MQKLLNSKGKYIVLLLIVFLFTSYRNSPLVSPTVFLRGQQTPKAELERKERVLMQAMMSALRSSHYNPEEINNEFSKKVFKSYLENLDYYKKFLIQADYDKLKKWETNLDEEINAGNYVFFNISYQIIEERVAEAESYFKDILEKPFDFTVEETIELDDTEKPFADSKKQLREYWRKALKYQVLTRLATEMDVYEKSRAQSDTVAERTIEEMEAEIRKKVAKSQQEWFDRLKKLNRQDRLSIYVNSIASEFDPHTNYYPPKDKENFDIALSGRLEGIGATLQEKDGYIKVVRIVPGSASWKQGDLEPNDIILKVAQGEESPVDVVDMRLDEAVKMIRGPKGTEVRLTVQKLDGTITIIPIIRDVVILEETYAHSMILTNKNTGHRYGYIKLPKFYADFSGQGGRNCSEDVEKEVKKLKAANVQGIVLDLRNNGGGSLRDVVEMSGLFIEGGPIVQVKNRGRAARVLDNRTGPMLYDGPLVVMVNHLSASASEIFAAAMQDYNRGIILGASSTFGKGTVQRFIDLDRLLNPDFGDLKPLGSIKLTTSKFYRVNGGATQLKGVIPDIITPDNYNYIEVGEKELEKAMIWDEIEPANYDSFDELATLKDQLINLSETRIQNNKVFSLIDENARRLKRTRDRTEVTLHFEKHRKEQNELREESEKYKNMLEPIEGFNAQPLPDEVASFAQDSTAATRNKNLVSNLKKDVYIYEATNIVDDWLKIGGPSVTKIKQEEE